MLKQIIQHLFSLRQEDGGYRPSPGPGYLGIADSAVSDLAATVYVAEIAQTLGASLPNPAQTVQYIQARQSPEGYFRSLTSHDGYATGLFDVFETCMSVRGMKALDQAPQYDPRPWVDTWIRTQESFGPYHPDFCANIYAALEAPMPEDCAAKLRKHLLSRPTADTGWLIQDPSLPPQLNNPCTFHAARTLHLLGGRLPRAKEVAQTFLSYQQEDGSWWMGGVHGTFDACVSLRLLGSGSEEEQRAIQRAADWALTCWKPGGGFNHFGDRKPAEMDARYVRFGQFKDYSGRTPAEVDACYFHTATLVMAGRLPNALPPNNNWIGWGHTLVGYKGAAS